MENTQEQVFCYHLGRKITPQEFEEAKEVYLGSVYPPKITKDWGLEILTSDLLDEVIDLATQNGYKPSIFEEGNKVPKKAIRRYRKQIAERIVDYVITSDEAETFTPSDYENKLGISEESINDYDKMLGEGVLYVLAKHKGNDTGLLDKEIQFYGNSVMAKDFRPETPSDTYHSAKEFLEGKK